MKILLVDDHTILLDGVKSLLSKEDDLTVVGQAGSAEAALEFLKKNEVDLIITDYSLPEMDGLSLVNTIKRIAPNTKVIVLSMHDEVHLVKEILKAGVNGYVLKNDTHKELLNAIRDVSQGKVYLSSDVNKMLITNLNNPDEGRLLTDREREILKLIAKEYTNKDIAEELFISERTVETHRKNIFKKTGTNSLVGLIKFAYANNLI
ncbi:MAG TPA: response regulator transcription factor [Cyclobacteriaceae bacterium]|nr:response regulator transcription factor [Cyclobacteriaceae bacterium]HMV88859.1 response regulator transcription factor [Cyclobacteriaceae bacterium]HMW99647.1 response regulator transcription factor [Cyclobacteriaceae bacterium]HMX50976.1 response regulator transcription factor [Cyclobacteriaceae bacterium]HMY94224.1 response regulator transcription factor [Cyclobacteriaceae bacterium]